MSIDQYYLLLEAYDRLGRRLFTKSWTGSEVFEVPLESPEEVQEKRYTLEEECAAITKEIRALAASKKKRIKKADLENITAAEAEAFERRNALQKPLQEIPEPNDSYRSRHAAFTRARTVEQCVLDALRKEDLTATMHGSQVIPSRVWTSEPGFKLYIDLSMVVVPRTYSSRRRHAVMIMRDEFEHWLEGVMPVEVDQDDPPSPFLLCRAWLRGKARKGPKTRSKASYFDEAQRLFSDLKKRTFQRAWDQATPESWRRSGRPKSRD